MATFKDFRNTVKPNWCPGCGDFSVQAAIQKQQQESALSRRTSLLLPVSAAQAVYQDISIHTASTASMDVHYRLLKV